jgi:two-component system, OmpR family, sensor kinase
VRLPIRTRLTLIFAGLSVLVLAVASAALLLRFRTELARTVDEGLWSRAASMPPDPRDMVGSAGEESFAQFVDADGSIVSSDGIDAPLLPASALRSITEPTYFDRDVRTSEETVPARLLAVPLPLGIGAFLIVGADVEDQREAVASLTTLVAVGGPILLLALSVVGWILAGAALRPVEELRSEASAISTSEPDRRLPVPETGDELQRLAETLNGMLDRLHEALDRERRFVDEASHELRTPLGVLKAEVDLALKEPRTRDELLAALGSIAQETERLRRLTQDLLVLARSDRGRLPVHREEVDVSRIVERVAAEFEERARAGAVGVRVSGTNVRARVDGDRVRQAVENLVDNAIRHAGGGGTVEVRVSLDDDRLRVDVRDSGPGFPGDLLDRVFEPFARADDDREVDGAGLGLAIVRAVAEAHGGSAAARNEADGGASVTLDLPT